MRLRFSTKLVLAMAVLAAAISLSALMVFYQFSESMLLRAMNGRLVDVSHAGTFLFEQSDREAIKSLTAEVLARGQARTVEKLALEPGDIWETLDPAESDQLHRDPRFQRLVQLLRRIKASSTRNTQGLRELMQAPSAGDEPLISFAYLMVPVPEAPKHRVVMFLADSDYEDFDANGDGQISDDEVGNRIGTVYAPPQAFPAMAQPFKDGRIHTSDDWYNDRWGTFISASVPIKDRDGQVIAALGVDYLETGDANKLRQLRYVAAALTGGAVLVSALLALLLAAPLNRPVRALTVGADRVSTGDFDVHVEVTSRDELGDLARTFNAMVDRIADYASNLEALVAERTAQLETANAEITALNERLHTENSRMRAELDVARELQAMVLPRDSELASVAELDVAAYMSPADQIGGDYYDFLPSESGVVKIGIGDVSGHGLQSGVVMLMVQTAVRTLWLSGERDREAFLAQINRLLFENVKRLQAQRSMTLSLLDYHGNGRFTVTGQHEDMLLIRASGEVEQIDTLALGMPLALDPEINDFLGTLELQMAAGDLLLLHTDGITEAEDPQRRFYGIERLSEVAAAHRALSAAEIVDAVIADMRQFIGDQEIFDDITLLVIKRRGADSPQR